MNAVKTRLGCAVLTGALGALVLMPAYGADAANSPGQGNKPADIGAATGFAIGAVAGGPVGAVVGTAAGALIGDHYHRQQQSKQALQADLDTSEAQRAELNADLAQLHSSLAATQAHDAALDESLQRTDQVGLDVSFRTADDSVNAAAMSPLLKLGALAASLPTAQIHVAGFTDPRGSDTYNDELSLRRAENVAAVLTQAGVPRERIVLEAHGKSASSAEQGDLDAYALERRVTVRLQLTAPEQVARRD
jgi:outer membrane protein OmpA-like peptidoglycan-associated protein